jgi:hypothetical protein
MRIDVNQNPLVTDHARVLSGEFELAVSTQSAECSASKYRRPLLAPPLR